MLDDLSLTRYSRVGLLPPIINPGCSICPWPNRPPCSRMIYSNPWTNSWTTRSWSIWSAIAWPVATRLRGAPGRQGIAPGPPVIMMRIIAIATAEYPTPSARPAYSLLSNSRLIQSFEPLPLSSQTGERSCNELSPRGMGSID